MPTNTSIPTLDGKGNIPALVVKPAGTPHAAERLWQSNQLLAEKARSTNV